MIDNPERSGQMVFEWPSTVFVESKQEGSDSNREVELGKIAGQATLSKQELTAITEQEV